MVQSVGCCSGRSALEKGLIFGVIVSILAAIGLLVGVIVLATQKCETEESKAESTTQQPSHANEICLTKGCIDTSYMLLKNMKLDVDPCEDFYEFSCGKFLEETIIPDDKTTVSSFNDISNKMDDHLRLLINKPAQDSDIKPFKDLKLFYQSCMDLDAMEELGLSQVLPKMNDMGDWPVLRSNGDWNGDQWTWQSTIAKLRNYGYSVGSIFSFSISTDSRNNAVRKGYIDQASLGLSYQYIIKKEQDKNYVAYKDYQIDIASLFGSTLSTEVLKQKMGDALEFEYKLASISLSPEERRDANKLYNPMSISELQQKYPKLNWLTYLNSLMPAETQFTSEDIIINATPTYFEKLFTLLDETPKETIANYLMWRVAASSVGYLSKKFRDRSFEYSKVFSGKEVEDARALQCTSMTSSYYSYAISSLYVRNYFKDEAKAKVLDMIKNIKEAFKGIIDEIDWMDSNTKIAAHKKVDNMGAQMAYADELLDNAKLTEYYNKLNVDINPKQFYDSVLKFSISNTKDSLNKLRQPIDKNDWTRFITPAIVNAFYSPLENTIKFPAGILQGAFFNSERPQYMNYGGIGFVIGHEITHGFDDSGSRYDDVGNLKNWWEGDTRAKFDERAKNIIDQYSAYVEPLTKLNLNGINTQGENIADNGGIKESYLAYQKWVEKNKPEPKLPGIDLTPNQLFWVSAGQVWCTVYREEAIRGQILTGVHSPAMFRVTGPMRNRPEFAKDFNCKEGSNMNPKTKYAVW